ncbi:MAG TPA: TonB-dependent receptor, partial [Salinimicrobium sp.]|nr:TonB-dependent receptor [Salinimicrobium sp.]
MIKNYAPALFFIFFLPSISALAQHKVQGKIIDQSNAPVAFANVILLNAADSTTVYKGAVTSENGNFLFEEIKEAEYVLKVSFVGYEDLLRKIEVNGNENLGEIILKESTASLDEVTITAQYPTVTREVDRLVFYVANSTLSSGNSWDILRKTPGVILANENLQVRNQPVEVYINDRKVQLSSAELKTLLENYSAENIKSVEVITNPPARYDAEGGAILNIITSKSISPGYKGSVNGSWTQAVFPKYSFGTSHYLRSEKLNLFANYSFNPRKEFKEDDSYINFMKNGEIFSRWLTDFERTTRSQAHNASLILDYSLNDKNILSFSTNAVLSPNKSFDNNVFTKILDGNDPRSFTTESTLNEDQSNVAMELKYKHLLEKPGAEISILGQFTTYDQDRDQQVFTDYSAEPDNSFSTLAQQHINIYVG